MKLLLSAYACEPHRGSEPGVGWNWAIECARLGHEVWVLTNGGRHGPAIENEVNHVTPPESLHFVFSDVPSWLRKFVRSGRLIRVHNLLWQWCAYKRALTLHKEIKFDVVHHVTWASIRSPSFMGNLGIPFVFGPVGGGETAPWRLRLGYGFRGLLYDGLRDLSNLFVRLDPLMRRTFRQADQIYVTSEQTLALVPAGLRKKTTIQLAIGIEKANILPVMSVRDSTARKQPGCRVLYVGRFLYWKGMHLGLEAFARFQKDQPGSRLTMVGTGPEETLWRKQTLNLGIEESVDWIKWVTRDELPLIYQSHDVFLFPSLHDSGGMVVLEAMAHGLPVVCLDLGGPGMIVDGRCGRVVSTKGATRSSIAKKLAESLVQIVKCRDGHRRSRLNALTRAGEFEWGEKVRDFCRCR